MQETLQKTEKKLADIFSVRQRTNGQNERVDESDKLDWLPPMRDVLEIYKERHKQSLAESHLITIWKQYVSASACAVNRC